MSEQRATYELPDALETVERQYLELLRRHHGPGVTVEVLTRRVLTPEPAPVRPSLTIVGDRVPLLEAARYVGKGKTTLRRYADEGRIRLLKDGDRVFVSRADVERLKVELER